MAAAPWAARIVSHALPGAGVLPHAARGFYAAPTARGRKPHRNRRSLSIPRARARARIGMWGGVPFPFWRLVSRGFVAHISVICVLM